MTVEEFEAMEVGNFLLKLFYHNMASERQRQFYGNVIRMQTMRLINIHLTQQSQYKEPKELWGYEWEEEKEKAERKKKPVTARQQQEQLKQLQDLAKKYING